MVIVIPYFPETSATGVSPSTYVAFAVEDYTTGVALSTVNFNLDSAIIYDNGSLQTSSGVMTVLTTASGYIFQYQPNDVFGYGSVHDVDIYAENNDMVPLTTASGYSFTIIPEGTLIIRNFFLNVGQSMYVTASTVMTVEVVDYTYGIDPDRTYFIVNGDVAPTALTPIESGMGYLLSFDPPNDFNYDTIIDVEVQARSNVI